MIAQPRKQTKEEADKQKERDRLYEYFGIPIGVFDADVPASVEKDWVREIALIAENNQIPEDLEKRLLRYKEGDFI